MRFNYTFLLTCSLIVFTSCIEYDRFERIEDDKLRVIAVRYEPTADFAPGDTLTGKVYFAGNKVSSVSDFSIAYIHNFDKNHSFPDERKIELIDTVFWLPDSMQFKYRIPEDVFVKENASDTAKMRSIIDLIKMNDLSGGTLLESIPKDSLPSIIAGLSSLYLRPNLFFHAHSINGFDLKVNSEFIIRYNSKFAQYLPINHNPQIKWVAVYKVPDDISKDFSPLNPGLAGKFDEFFLYNEYLPEKVIDTIEIDDGYKYFLFADYGINTYVNLSGDTIHDTTCDFVAYPTKDTVYNLPEAYFYKWFFQNIDNVDEVKDSLLTVGSSGSVMNLVELNPPVFTSMKKFKIWLVVYDGFGDQYDRPKGYAMRSISGVFEYTEAYQKSLEKKNSH